MTDHTPRFKPFPHVEHPEWCSPWFCEDLGHSYTHREPVAIFKADVDDVRVRIYRTRYDELAPSNGEWLPGDRVVALVHMEHTTDGYNIDGRHVPTEIETAFTAAGCRQFAAELLAVADRIEGDQ